MFRKIAFCPFALAVVVMAAPALAISGDDYFIDPYPDPSVLIKVDIDAFGNTGPNETQIGWTAWEMSGYDGPLGAQTKDFGYGSGLPIVTIDGVTAADGVGNLGGSRDRIDDYIIYDYDLPQMHSDFVYVGHTASGMGKDYIKVTFDFGPMRANYNYDITLWSWDPNIYGSGLPGFSGAGEPPYSKWAAWSTRDPAKWLTDNGYDPNGYGYPSIPDGSNMPAGLMALVGDMAPMQGTAPWVSAFDGAFGITYSSTVNVTLNENGQVTLYGWADMTSEIGYKNIVLNGFLVTVPEPVTILLFTLGSLALMKKRHRKL